MFIKVIVLALSLFYFASDISAGDRCKTSIRSYGYYSYSPYRPERERRDEGVYPFLKASVGAEKPSSCSATIIYYDADTSTAYVLGCAHCHRAAGDVKILTYFSGDKKEKRKFDGRVLVYDTHNDLCLMSFKPDFIPHWIPVGLKDSPFYYPTKAPVGHRIVVTGRDAGLPDGNRDPAAYECFIRAVHDDWYLESRQSQSRGGRSGGGVMTDDARWLIGINRSRGATVNGVGHGLWTPLHRIHSFLEQNHYGWLLNVVGQFRHIPIVDSSGEILEIDDEYLPLPYIRNNYKYTPLKQ